MKLDLYVTDSDELAFYLATADQVAHGIYYEVPQALAEKWLSAQAAFEEAQAEADIWMVAHPPLYQEPDVEVAGLEPIYTDQFEN